MKFAQNFLLAVVGVFLALLALELLARWLPPPFDSSQTNPAESCWPATGWRGNPNFETTVATGDYVHNLKLNSRGMHDTEQPEANPDGRFRILMLGDSFVHAIQVTETDTAHQILEDTLNRTADRFQVISAGVSGWGTGQQLRYYQEEGRNYRPDLVLLMFYLDNDIKDNLPGRGITVNGKNCYAPYFVLADNTLDPNPWRYAPGLPPAMKQTNWLRKLVNNFLGAIHPHSALYTQLEPLLAPTPVKINMLDFYTGNDPTFDYGVELTTQLVRRLQAEVERDGAKFGVVIISPLNLIEFMQMDDAAREQVYQRLPILRRAEEIDPPNVTLARQFAVDDAPVLDLLPAFLQAQTETGIPLYFAQDKHWNAAGNRLAAETIARWLAQQQLIPQN